MQQMNLNRFDLNLFVVFEAIYQEGSLTRAAQRLHLSQPAVSHALARLRERLGDALFTRQGQRMLPTPLARQLIVPVQQGLRELARGLAEPAVFEPAQAQRGFHIAMREALEATLLPPLLARLQREAPGVSLYCVRSERRDLAAELASGRLDLTVDLALPTGEGVRHQPLLRDELVVVARRGHPALPPGGALDLPTYLAQAHVLVSSRRSGPGLADHELNRQGLRWRIGLRCQHAFAACRVVAATDLLLTLPGRHAQLANAGLANALQPFPLAMPRLEAHLYWHASADADPAGAWLRGVVQAVAAELA